VKDNNEKLPLPKQPDMVVYDPDNLPYEKVHLCIYLRELPELDAEGKEIPKDQDN
jgi:hypothetical protein